MVDVAQLAERLTVDQEVAGSYPVIHPQLWKDDREADGAGLESQWAATPRGFESHSFLFILHLRQSCLASL